MSKTNVIKVIVFAKIFTQIFDSSIADDHVVRHVFMDLLVLADPTGVVDMTPDAISRRTNVPKEIIQHALEVLSNPDTRSRSHVEEGARIVLIDSHREWGWQIVNYDHYRKLQDEESRRTYFRNKKRESRQRSKSTESNPSNDVQTVKNGQSNSTQEEEEEEVEEEGQVPPSKTFPQDEFDIEPEMVATGLADRLMISVGYGPNSTRDAINEVARAEKKSGRNMKELAAEMETAWRYYEEVKPTLKITWGNRLFFGDGHWRNPDAWQRKEGNSNGQISASEGRRRQQEANAIEAKRILDSGELDGISPR